MYRIYMLKKRYCLFSFIMPLLIGFLQATCFDYYYGWLGTFLYSLLFFIVSEKPFKGFLQGYLYGISYFSVHSWGLTTFIDVNDFESYYKLIPILFYFLLALYSALWFILLSSVKKYVKAWKRYLLYAHITCFYMWWLHYKVFMIFLIDMGCPLLFSLTPSINNSTLTYLFYKTGLFVGTYIIILINSLFTYILEKKGCFYYFFVIVMSVLFLIVSTIFTQYQPLPHDETEKIMHVRSPHKSDNVDAVLEQICRKSNKKLKNMSENKNLLLVFSESVLPFCFSQKILQILHANVLYDSRIQILLGSFYNEGENLYNSLFLLQKSRIILRYDKKVLLPFWEFIPKNEKLPLNKLFGTFLNGITPFSFGSQNVYNFFYFNKKLYITALCSELFWSSFNKYSSDIHLMCLLNDSHFEGSLLQRIMLLYGRFVAGTQRRKIFYMATLQGFIIAEDGSVVKKI